MKKLYVLLLTVFVVSSVALVAIACGSEAETTTTAAAEETTVTEEVTTTEAASTALTPADVKALGDQLIADYQAAGSPEDKSTFVVNDVTFVGPVFAVKDKGTFYIVSIGDETTSANVLISYDTLATAGMTADVLNAWIGSDIQVNGDIVVNDWGSLAEIQIADPLTQISVPE